MSSKTPKISLERLREIIKEEVALSEATKSPSAHAAKAAVSSAASKLLAAIEDFKEDATPAVISAVTPHLSQLEDLLDDMTETPGAYIVKPKLEPKKVTLKPVKSSD